MNSFIKIYGSSDDLIEIEGLFDEEINVISDNLLVGFIDIRNHKFGLRIYVIYDGCWCFSMTPQHDEFMPDWEIKRTFGEDCGYSETIEIHCPKNVTWEFKKAK